MLFTPGSLVQFHPGQLRESYFPLSGGCKKASVKWVFVSWAWMEPCVAFRLPRIKASMLNRINIGQLTASTEVTCWDWLCEWYLNHKCFLLVGRDYNDLIYIKGNHYVDVFCVACISSVCKIRVCFNSFTSGIHFRVNHTIYLVNEHWFTIFVCVYYIT